MPSPKEAFWSYTIDLYARTEATCLKFQDHYDLDVNLLLFCCWTGGSGVWIKAADMAPLIAAVTPFRENAIRPLRDARRWMETQGDAADTDKVKALSKDILMLEVAAERIVQGRILAAAAPTRLANPVPAPAPGTGCAVAAFLLCCYVEAVGVARTDLMKLLFVDLLAEAFPALAPAAIEACIKRYW